MTCGNYDTVKFMGTWNLAPSGFVMKITTVYWILITPSKHGLSFPLHSKFP
uniref:Uncharacterized protein n=1 Tax=Rhizophora mucronata TaxID=61149 RepID=A0A2P2PP56_RHIMU